MTSKFLLSMVTVALMSWAQVSFAAEECKDDKDCKDGNVCILALTPHVCKAPQPAGEPCKRDAVCASNKCEIPEGKEVGACK